MNAVLPCGRGSAFGARPGATTFLRAQAPRFIALALLVLSACRVNVELGLEPPDSGPADAGSTMDAAPMTTADAGEPPQDASRAMIDSGSIDSGSSDSGIMIDAGAHDAGSSDAAVITQIGIVTAGQYTISVMDGPQTMCFDALAGHEGDFAGITAASLNFETGPVTVHTSSVITVSGAPILAAYGSPWVDLYKGDGMGTDPPPSWFANQLNTSGHGPNGTSEVARLLAIDSSVNGQAQNGFLGQAGVAYTNTSSSGSCVVEFLMLFSH